MRILNSCDVILQTNQGVRQAVQPHT